MKKSLLTLALTAALPLASAHAEFTFNGFANIVAGKTSSGDSLFGYDDDINFKEDSLFALQTSADLGDGLSMTAQIIARGEDDWDAEFEWAYLTYNINEQTSVLVGRQRAPLYMYSEYLDVSYAMPWISVPDDVYVTLFSKFDGITLNRQFAFDNFEGSIQLFSGSESTDVEIVGDDIETDFDSIYGVNLSLSNGWLTFNTAYATTQLTVPDSRVDVLGNFWLEQPGFEFVANEITVDDDTLTFGEVGIQIEYDNWLFISEYTHQDYEEMTLDKQEAFYATIGYRFDEVLVHATFTKLESEVNSVQNDLPEATTALLAEQIADTRALVNFRKQDSSTYSIGARWDFHESAALKVEFTEQDDKLTDQSTQLVRTAIVTVF